MREHILLVEDDDPTREVLTLLLEADGWTVRGVESGEAALEALRLEPLHPNVVLCDLHLPGIHGADLAVGLREAAPAATLLGMSASAPGETSMGYAAMLQKPFGPAEVRTTLERAARAASSAITPTIEEPVYRTDVPAEAGDDLPVLAMATVLKLEQQMGARTRDLYAFALADAGDRLRRMREHEQTGANAAFRAEAHQLKGSAGMIGAKRLAALAGAAETEGALSQRASPDKRLQEMHLACDEIRLMLKTLFSI